MEKTLTQFQGAKISAHSIAQLYLIEQHTILRDFENQAKSLEVLASVLLHTMAIQDAQRLSHS